ncbi:hypothetical protein IKG54_01915 [Candidatus Saccharibacteria bacterium]|nr:hypothetical protein [Candidatus Saccharibacteria bacterium]
MSESEKLNQGLQYYGQAQREEAIARYTNLLADMQPNHDTLLEMRLSCHDRMNYYLSDEAAADYRKISYQDTAIFMVVLSIFCILPIYSILLIGYSSANNIATIPLLVLFMVILTILVHILMSAWGQACLKSDTARCAVTICAINNLLSQ